jgi:membrane-bound serine protease (ClpP class)
MTRGRARGLTERRLLYTCCVNHSGVPAGDPEGRALGRAALFVLTFLIAFACPSFLVTAVATGSPTGSSTLEPAPDDRDRAGARPDEAQGASNASAKDDDVPAVSPARMGRHADIHVVQLEGIIHPVSAAYLTGALERADQAGAAALIIEMNTPGGLVSSTKELIQKILAAKTPVIGYVTPSGADAASGGFFLLMACDAAVMSPGTNTGAAHPVMGGGDNTKENIEIQKAQSDLAAFARSIAENRGRDVALVESAVTKIVSWTENEALRAKLIDLIARDRDELVRGLDGRKVKRMGGRVETLDLRGAIVPSSAMTAAERFQGFLLTPLVAFLLLGLGLLGIYIEMNHPGLVFPGAVGAVCLILFAYAAHILPVSALGLILIALSIVLFVLEIKFVSHGLLGIGGVIALIAGSLMLFKGDIPELRLHPLFVIPIAFVVGSLMFLVVTYVVRARREKIATGREGMIGEVGVAATDLTPDGKIFVHGEYWNAHADGTVERGARVRIRAVDEMRLLVEPARREA